MLSPGRQSGVAPICMTSGHGFRVVRCPRATPRAREEHTHERGGWAWSQGTTRPARPRAGDGSAGLRAAEKIAPAPGRTRAARRGNSSTKSRQMTKNKLLLVSVFERADRRRGCGAGGRGHLKKLDTNGDGVVTTAEITDGGLERGRTVDRQGRKVTAARQRRRSPSTGNMFGKRDANGDGKLSKGRDRKCRGPLHRIRHRQGRSLSVNELEPHPGEGKHQHGHEASCPATRMATSESPGRKRARAQAARSR